MMLPLDGGHPTLPKSQTTLSRAFRTADFIVTAVGSFGNAGVGILRGPGVNNWDAALNKPIPLGRNERRTLQLWVEAYNVFNHTQFTTVNSAAQFNPTAGDQPEFRGLHGGGAGPHPFVPIAGTVLRKL